MKPSLLIISAGILQVPAILKAKKLGYHTIVTDQNPKSPGFSHCDEKIFLSTKDIEGHELLAKKLKKSKNLVGVYTQGTDVEYTVAKAAKAAGLPGIDPEVARKCNDKIMMRKLFKSKNVEKMKFQSASNYTQALSAVKKIGFPCIIKPDDNSGSRGITVVKSLSAVKKAFDEAIKGCYHRKEVIIEEFLQGVEYSVDTIVWDGKVYPCGISDRTFLKSSKYRIQSGSLTPSLLPSSIQHEMYEVMQKAASAIGVDKGAFKGDLILVKNKVKIIEVTARTSGGFDSQYRKPYSFGIDMLKATIDIAVGKELDFRDIVPRWAKWSKTLSVFPKPGKIKKISGIKTAKKIPGVKDIFIIADKGDIVGDYRHSASRVNFVNIISDTFENLAVIEKMVRKTIRYEME